MVSGEGGEERSRPTHLIKFLEVILGSRIAPPTRLLPVMKIPLQNGTVGVSNRCQGGPGRRALGPGLGCSTGPTLTMQRQLLRDRRRERSRDCSRSRGRCSGTRKTASSS